MPSQFLVWNTASQHSPTHYARFPNSPLEAGRGCAVRLPPSAMARRRTRTPRPTKLSADTPTGPPSTTWPRTPRPTKLSLSLTGQYKSSQLAPVPPLTPRTAPLSALISYDWCDFWMTRDRSRFLFLRRVTRLPRELYKVLG